MQRIRISIGFQVGRITRAGGTNQDLARPQVYADFFGGGLFGAAFWAGLFGGGGFPMSLTNVLAEVSTDGTLRKSSPRPLRRNLRGAGVSLDRSSSRLRARLFWILAVGYAAIILVLPLALSSSLFVALAMRLPAALALGLAAPLVALAFAFVPGILSLPHQRWIVPAKLPTDVGVGALIGMRAELGKGTQIGEGVLIDHGARLGDRTNVEPGAYIGGATTIAADLFIPAAAAIRSRTRLRQQADVAANRVNAESNDLAT